MSDQPLVITAAVVGAEWTRKDTPYLPITPEEIAQSARRAVEAGAQVIHLHVRDEQGAPSQRVDIFEDVTERIRGLCDCVLQFSTGGAVGTPLADRIAPLSLKPQMGSLSMGTMNFGAAVFENSESTITAIAEAMKEHKVRAELEIFDFGMLDSVERYRKKGMVPERFHIQFVLGVPGGAGGAVENLTAMVGRLAPGQAWSVAGIGRWQTPLNAHAMAMGGHVRT
ncbi:MAG: 3-keto-5-aminohexanoate cleavage protein, partial [Nitrospinota bacterium]|nr:3-keto-5-aminohexanoate cleavage protein [Nitrospinota bacterium]